LHQCNYTFMSERAQCHLSRSFRAVSAQLSCTEIECRGNCTENARKMVMPVPIAIK
jgi:hypothetical protein